MHSNIWKGFVNYDRQGDNLDSSKKPTHSNKSKALYTSRSRASLQVFIPLLKRPLKGRLWWAIRFSFPGILLVRLVSTDRLVWSYEDHVWRGRDPPGAFISEIKIPVLLNKGSWLSGSGQVAGDWGTITMPLPLNIQVWPDPAHPYQSWISTKSKIETVCVKSGSSESYQVAYIKEVMAFLVLLNVWIQRFDRNVHFKTRSCGYNGYR